MVMIEDASTFIASSAKDCFDVESAIDGFRADPNRASFELPRLLSADQRKHAKKIAEGYPDLKCESFGLGKDRQLHLFKCNAADKSISEEATSECPPQRVSVKNTFIDDWISSNELKADARVVQSMPHNMFGQCLTAELAALAEPEAEQSAAEESEPEGEGATNEADASTAPNNDGPKLCRRWANVPLFELPIEEQMFAVGAEVVIEGLVKAPSFNGASGVVQSYDAETGRYNVLLVGQRWAKIKGENLQYTRPR
jgi:hypothetical protein